MAVQNLGDATLTVSDIAPDGTEMSWVTAVRDDATGEIAASEEAEYEFDVTPPPGTSDAASIDLAIIIQSDDSDEAIYAVVLDATVAEPNHSPAGTRASRRFILNPDYMQDELDAIGKE